MHVFSNLWIPIFAEMLNFANKGYQDERIVPHID